MPKMILLAALGLVVLAGGGSAYCLSPTLLTPTERSFLGVLERELPPGVRVFGKVRLAGIFAVKAGRERGVRQSALNRIDRKHVDFLPVRAADLVPLAGIGLDDRSHEAEDRRLRDALVDTVFAVSGLPLLQVAVRETYLSAELKAKVAALLAERKGTALVRGRSFAPPHTRSPRLLGIDQRSTC